MFRTGLEMMRQNLRRHHPDADAAEIEERIRKWLHERPGAEHGDAAGQPVTLRRRKAPRSKVRSRR